MNVVTLTGRLTRDPECRESAETSVCRFSIAINRGKSKDGQDLGADYPNIVCFGRTAINCNKFIKKGSLVGVTGKLQTGSYEKDGKKVYTTEVLADRVEFFDRVEKEEKDGQIPMGFSKMDESDLPF